MSIDQTLKRGSRLSRSRNVMTRDERIAKMIERGTFKPEEDTPFGLPKTRVAKAVAGKKKKKKKKDEDEE